jgi:DNA-binding transcriptional LysR family regulator
MELRHLRYVMAVAEERSLRLAAEKRLRTAQPSLSRQIRDREREAMRASHLQANAAQSECRDLMRTAASVRIAL